jgi:hypothetical protein
MGGAFSLTRWVSTALFPVQPSICGSKSAQTFDLWSAGDGYCPAVCNLRWFSLSQATNGVMSPSAQAPPPAEEEEEEERRR